MGLLDGLIASLPDAKGSAPSAKSSSGGGGEIESLLRNKAAEYDIDPDLFVSLAKRESGLRPDAKNPGSTAGGLFQFIDGTWSRYGNKKDKFDPEANADAAARMLRDHLGMFEGDYTKALAAHHVGAGKAATALTDRRVGDKDVSTQQWLSDIFTGAGRDNPLAKPRGAFADAESGVGGYDQIRRGQIAQAASDDSPVSTSLKRGMKGLAHSAGLAVDNMLGDSEGAAQRIIDKQSFDQATPAPSSVQKFGRDWDALAEDDYTGMFGTILKNPAGSFNMMLEQTPNSLPGMAFQTIAGVAGRGLMALGPVGAAAGLGLQGLSAFAGNFLPEGGAFIEEQLHKSGVDTNDVRAVAKWIEEHRGENFKGGATKAGVISAVDGVTGWMGMKMLAGPSVRFAKAEKDFFAKNGVNVADSAALQAARAGDAYKAAMQPFAADLVKASEGFGMLKRGVGATALDAMGEGVGEYAGSYAATGDASIKDAVLEGVMGVGQGAAMAGAQYGIGKMSGPDQAMEELRKLATANIAPAEAKPNSPLSNAAQAAQAADPITEALKPISERFADRALYEQIRNHPNLGPDAMTQILSAYRVATNSNMDPMARQAAVDRLGEFFRLFDNQPNFTAGRADAPGVPAVVGNKPSAVGPVDPRVGAIDGEASRVAPNQQQGVVTQSAPALATDERARKAAAAEYEAAYQDLVKAEQLGVSDQELMQRQIAMRNAENRLQEINEAIEANRAKETAEKRGALLDRVLASNPGNPNRAFDRALRLEGFRDAAFTKEEKEKIARFNELRSIQEDGVFSAPNEAGAFGIREKRPSASAGRYQHIADMLSSGWQLVNKHQLTGPNGEVYNLKGAGEAQFVRNKLNQKAGNGSQSPRGGSQGGTDQGDFGVGGAGANGPVPQGGGNGSGQANAIPDTDAPAGAVSEAEATGAGNQPNNSLARSRLTALEDQRIAKYADELRSMAPDSGWAEEGGRLLIAPDGTKSRTKWIPRAEWFVAGMLNSPQESVAAVEKAISGQPMRKAEKLHVQGMMDFLDMQHGIDGESHTEQLATLSDIAYEGESADAQNIIDTLGDVDLESNGAWADEVESMRALGFTEEEINEITRRKQGAFGAVGEEAAGVPAGEAQTAIPEGDGNGNGQAEGQEGFSLNQQTNTEAAAQFAQQQAGESTEITKEQADKERDAVPFSMQMQSQPKPQGMQVGLFTADGRPTVAAKQEEKIDTGFVSRAIYDATNADPTKKDDAPLSTDDAQFILESLLDRAKRGKLSPETFAQSEIGQRLDTATIMAANAAIKANPVAAIEAMLSRLAETNNQSEQKNGKPTFAQFKKSPYQIKVGDTLVHDGLEYTVKDSNELGIVGERPNGEYQSTVRIFERGEELHRARYRALYGEIAKSELPDDKPGMAKRKIFRNGKSGVREVHEVDAQDVAISELPDHQFFVFKDEEKGAYSLTEASTGLRVGVGETAEAAVADFESKLEKVGAETVAKHVAASPKIPGAEGAKPTAPQPAAKSSVIRTYKTKSGKIGARIEKVVGPTGKVFYNYTGEWGAGSGHALAQMDKIESMWRKEKRGYTVVEAEAAAKPVADEVPFKDGKASKADVMRELAKINEQMPEGYQAADGSTGLELLKDGKVVGNVYGLSRVNGYGELLRIAKKLHSEGAAPMFGIDPTAAPLSANQFSKDAPIKNPATMDEFAKAVDDGYRAHYDFAGTDGRTIWIQPTANGWTIRWVDDEYPGTTHTKGAAGAGAWDKLNAINAAKAQVEYRFNQWKPLADSAPSPVDTSMRDMGAKAFADGLPRVTPEGMKGADKVRWLTSYDDAAKSYGKSQPAASDVFEKMAARMEVEQIEGSDEYVVFERGERGNQNFARFTIGKGGNPVRIKHFFESASTRTPVDMAIKKWAESQQKTDNRVWNDTEYSGVQHDTTSSPVRTWRYKGRRSEAIEFAGSELLPEYPQFYRQELVDSLPADLVEYVQGEVRKRLDWYDKEFGVIGSDKTPLAPPVSRQKTDEAQNSSEQASPVSQTENENPAYADDSELQDALSHLGDVLGDVFGAKLNITGKQYGASDLLPAMSKVIELLIKKGFKSFRESVGAATNAMRGNANTKGFVDQITPRQWKAAYNSVAEFHEGTDSEEDVAKYSAEQIQKIIALPEKIKEAEQATNHDATPGQKESGNYAKGKFAWHGLNIAVETAKGEDRTDKETNGEKWRVTMPATYGYVLGSEGADGDHVDVFMGDKPESQRVYVINQTKPGSTDFDEHKIMLGYDTEDKAMVDYLLSFTGTFGHSVLGSISGPYSIDDFKSMLESNRLKHAKPISDRLAYVNPRVEESTAEQQPPGVKTNGTKEKAAAERLAQLLDKMDQVRMDRNTPEGSAKGIIRSAIEELRKERSVGNIPGLLDTAAQRLFRQYSAFSDVVSEVAESLRAADKYAETVAKVKAKQEERNTPTLDKITVTRSATLDGKAVEYDQQADEALKEIDSNMDLAKRLLECLAA